MNSGGPSATLSLSSYFYYLDSFYYFLSFNNFNIKYMVNPIIIKVVHTTPTIIDTFVEFRL